MMKCLQYCFQYCFAQRPVPGLLNSLGRNLLCSASAESDLHHEGSTVAAEISLL